VFNLKKAGDFCTNCKGLKNKSHNSDCSVLWLFAETLFLISYQLNI